jgi:hypothetical protein
VSVLYEGTCIIGCHIIFPLFAETLPPNHFLMQQQSKYGSNFTYPDITHLESEVIMHDEKKILD